MTRIGASAFSVRPGEHGCFRVADAADRDRLDAAFVRAGLRRGHMVVYLCAESAQDETSTRLRRSFDDAVDEALARGQIEVRDARAACQPDGAFDLDRMLEAIRDEHARAVYRGYTGLSLAGDVGAALSFTDPDPIAEIERRLDRALAGGTRCSFAGPRHCASPASSTTSPPPNSPPRSTSTSTGHGASISLT